MKKFGFLILIFLGIAFKSFAQIDFDHLNITDIIGKVMYVKKGFAPHFSLGKNPINKIHKVAEVLGLKKDSEVDRLFRTFNTGRTVYKVAAYAGGAIAIYGIGRKISKTAQSVNGSAALATGLVSIGSGLAVKFLTKSASYKAVDIFNNIAIKKIKSIFSLQPASSNLGVGLFVKLN